MAAWIDFDRVGYSDVDVNCKSCEKINPEQMKKFTLEVVQHDDGTIKHIITIDGFNKLEILGILSLEISENNKKIFNGKPKRTTKTLKK